MCEVVRIMTLLYQVSLCHLCQVSLCHLEILTKEILNHIIAIHFISEVDNDVLISVPITLNREMYVRRYHFNLNRTKTVQLLILFFLVLVFQGC